MSLDIKRPPQPSAEQANAPHFWIDGEAERARLERFERLSRMARRMLGTPVLSIIDQAGEQFWDAEHATSPSTQALEQSRLWNELCQCDETCWLADARLDSRWAGDSVVGATAGLQFLAASPLRSLDGVRLGTLIVADRQSRQFTEEDQSALDDLACTVAAELALQRNSTTDVMTALANRAGLHSSGQTVLELCRRQGHPLSVLYFDLKDFKQINDTYGHQEGDAALCAFASLLKQVARRSDLVARMGGDEFVVLSMHQGSGHETAPLLNRLRSAVLNHNQTAGKSYAIDYSVGVSTTPISESTQFADLVAHADASMYAHKHSSRRSDKRSDKRRDSATPSQSRW